MIDISNLTFGYRSRPVFSNVSLSLAEGRIYGLLGENGAGKTTLMKLIAGLLGGTGDCTVNGFHPRERSPEFLCNVFYLPEDFSGGDITAENLFGSVAPFYPSCSHGAFSYYMSELGVPGGQHLSEISTGQRKKAAISIALALGTELLLLDEPTNGLDIPSKIKLRSILKEWHSEKKTLVISTHQVRDIEDVVDSVIILDHGKLSVRDIVRTDGPVRMDLEALFSSATAAQGYVPMKQTYHEEQCF